jgi:hypothetical protein
MATVSPRIGKEKEVAQMLLALASDPRDVQTNTDDGFVFVIPEDVYQLYLDLTTDPDPGPQAGDQAKRRPGRPRKIVTPDSEKDGDE